MAQGEQEKGKSCVICLESDHAEEQCALYSPPLKSAASGKCGGSSDQRESSLSASSRGKLPQRMHASDGIRPNADSLHASIGTSVPVVVVTTESTSATG